MVVCCSLRWFAVFQCSPDSDIVKMAEQAPLSEKSTENAFGL